MSANEEGYLLEEREEEMPANKEEFLVEEREENLLKIDGSTVSIKRKGWFLVPHMYTLDGTTGVPFFPSVQLSSFDDITELARKIAFKGWLNNPRPTWEQWVRKLSPIFGNLWKDVGIFDALEVSTYQIKRDLTPMFQAILFWSSETNTFIFPSHEATLTLEDTMILGGFSLLGECVLGIQPLTGHLKEFNSRLTTDYKSFNKSSAKKPSFGLWMDHYMNCNDHNIEHIAFLSFWLSRYVFPRSPGDVIQKELFPIAILIAQGKKFALGPVVLANLYRDMRLLKKNLSSRDKDDVLPFSVWAPFHLLQMWLWEHFPFLSQNASPRFYEHEKPRANRWRNLSLKNVQDSSAVFQSLDNFQWRPYSKMFNNWRPPTYYGGDGQWICGNDVIDEGIISFAQCLKSCELIGLDTIELYLPERVARQFGYDQDLLGCVHVKNSNSDRELAWATYKKDAMSYMLYLPPHNFEPNVTYQYYSWWQKHAEAEREKVAIESARKKHMLQTDLNITPLELPDSLFESNGLTRCNLRIIKSLARSTKVSPGTAQNRPTNYANNENTVSASGDEESGDGLDEFNSTESESFDGGECSNFMEDQENTYEKRHPSPK